MFSREQPVECLNVTATEVMELARHVGRRFGSEDGGYVTLEDLVIHLEDADGRGGRTDASGILRFVHDPSSGYYDLDNGSLDPWHVDDVSAVLAGGETLSLDEFILRYVVPTHGDLRIDVATGVVYDPYDGEYRRLSDDPALERVDRAALCREIHASGRYFGGRVDPERIDDVERLYLDRSCGFSEEPWLGDERRVSDHSTAELIVMLRDRRRMR